jgi:hypothetical protein
MRAKRALLLSLVILITATSAVAHHSFAREYDSRNPVSLKGTVTMLDFTNPHSWLYIDVKDNKGMTISWGIELGPMIDLRHQGWSKTTLKPGIEVAIDAFRAKNGSNTANARSVKLSDGRVLFTAGSAMPPQTKK